VRAFTCPNCSALTFFQNSVCLSCDSAIGYLRAQQRFATLTTTPDATIGHRDDTGATYVACANLGLAGCNWLVDRTVAGGLCDCCALTRTRPADGDSDGLRFFARAEKAKRQLVYQLDVLGLPTTPRALDPDHGLAFDLLSSEDEPVITGHDNGVITIDLAEGDDPHREALRHSLGEPYRTLLGHLRHEIGHWYFDVLIAENDASLQAFRSLFGDERADYAEALDRHYGRQRDDSWRADHISDYAASHPWEDWAETFAHYLHLTDTLETAYHYGLSLSGPRVDEAPNAWVTTSPAADYADFDELLTAWLSLTYALNAVNRSMGKDDLYPFVLVPAVIEKLRFVHAAISRPQD
jgi:hypothetical protein